MNEWMNSLCFYKPKGQHGWLRIADVLIVNNLSKPLTCCIYCNSNVFASCILEIPVLSTVTYSICSHQKQHGLSHLTYVITGSPILQISPSNSERCCESADGRRGDGRVWSECRCSAEWHHGPVQDVPDVWTFAAQSRQTGQPATVSNPTASTSRPHWEVCKNSLAYIQHF